MCWVEICPMGFLLRSFRSDLGAGGEGLREPLQKRPPGLKPRLFYRAVLRVKTRFPGLKSGATPLGCEGGLHHFADYAAIGSQAGGLNARLHRLHYRAHVLRPERGSLAS